MGDPVLRSEATDIETVDDTTRRLIADMLETMDANEGVGLAANQVGVLKRVFVYDCSTEDTPLRGAIVNPVWEPVGDETQIGPEGCLSIPGIMEETERYNHVRVTGLNENGEPVDMEATGLMARCIQHETDHLDGILFLKRLKPEDRRHAMEIIRASDWFNQD